MPKKPVAVSLRKPPQPADIDSFVGADSTPAPPASRSVRKPAAKASTSTTATATASKPESIVTHAGREYREVVVYLPSDVAQKLSFYCMDVNRDLNGVVTEAVSRYVAPVPVVTTTEHTVVPSSLRSRLRLLARSAVSIRSLLAFRPWISPS